jgi:hypothetical protein
LQKRNELILGRGWGQLGQTAFPYSHLYFLVFRQIVKILCVGPRSQAMRTATARSYGGDPRPFSFPITGGLEMLDVAERHRLFELAAPLLARWPQRFAEVCQEARVWRSWALRECPCPPFALAAVVDQYLGAGVYQPSIAEIRAASRYLQRVAPGATKHGLRRLIGDCSAIDIVFERSSEEN